MLYVRLSILLVVLSSSLLAQAAAEAAAGAAAATTTAAPSQKLGKSISGALDSVGRAVQNSANPKPTSSPAVKSPAAAPARGAMQSVPATTSPVPKVSFEDPAGIKEGMEYGEVIRRFGTPSLELTTGADSQTLCYTKDDTNLDVTVRGGKVTAVQKAGTPATTGK